MNYVLVIDHIATGGAERILIDYYHYLVEKGHRVSIFVLSGYNGQSEWTQNTNVYYGSDCDKENLCAKAIQQLKLLFKLKRLIDTTQPDVLFSFLEKSNLLTTFIPTKAIKVVSVHNVLSIQYKKVKSEKIRMILFKIIRRMYNRCPNVIVVSKQVKDDLIASFAVKEKNIHVVNNYVDREDIHLKSVQTVDNFLFQPNIKYIMTIGRFSDQKAQWKLLKAYSIYLKCAKENVHLILIGQGEHLENLKLLVNNLGIGDKVSFLPFNINPYKYMKHAHLFVLSSIFEGFPIVLAEVSSLRIPFVGAHKAIPEEMFSDHTVWKQCIFENRLFDADFSITIQEDEKNLALLMKRGVEDNEFRERILSNTLEWERNNEKRTQFEIYESINSHK